MRKYIKKWSKNHLPEMGYSLSKNGAPINSYGETGNLSYIDSPTGGSTIKNIETVAIQRKKGLDRILGAITFSFNSDKKVRELTVSGASKIKTSRRIGGSNYKTRRGNIEYHKDAFAPTTRFKDAEIKWIEENW
jgi:hypothetical protein